MFNLIPRNDAYFKDFDDTIQRVEEMARMFHEGISQAEIPKDLSVRISELARENDRVVRGCLRRLDESFVTPIEREDIHTLILVIDDVADSVAETADRLDIFDINESTPELLALAGAISEMATLLVSAVSQLRTLRPAAVREATARVREIEERVDQQFREALRRLFQRRPEAYDLLRWREVYDLLEAAADNGREVARTIDRVLVRHS